MAETFASLEGMSAEDIARLAHVAQTVFTNPKTRTQAQKLVKEIDPNANFPELDIDERLRKHEEKMLEELSKRDKIEAERRAADDRQRQLRDLTAAGLRAEDVTIDPEKKVAPIEQFMIDNKISDYSAAARLFKMSQAPATAQNSPYMSSAPTAPQLPTIDMAGKSLNQWARDQAYETWNGIKSGQLKFNEMGVPIN